MTALAKTEPSAAPDVEYRLARTIEAVRSLRQDLERLGADDDLGLRADMIEGETSLNEWLALILKSIDDDAILLAGIKERKADLGTRERRIKHGVERKRALIERAMAEAGLDKITLPIATLSLVPRPAGVIVTDEAALPSEFFRQPPPPPPEVDTEALAERLRARAKAFEAAEAIADPTERLEAMQAAALAHPAIPGATLGNGTRTLTVRTK